MRLSRAVILAAGNGTRLHGIVPAGMKPLLLMNGEPLIKRLYRQAHDECDSIVIVVSPTNATAIVDVMGRHNSRIQYVVQPAADGPGEALIRAMWPSRKNGSDRIMVLMGDNYLDDGACAEAIRAAEIYNVVVSTTQIPSHIQDWWKRFTAVRVNNNEIVASEEGRRECPSPLDDSWHPWVGPLVLPMIETYETLVGELVVGLELKIGQHIATIARKVAKSPHGPGLMQGCVVSVGARDIGTPEALS